MNVWAIDKDIPLKLLLLELKARYGDDAPVLNEQEQCGKAIEIYNPNTADLAAYVYTFGQSTGRYGIDLKYPIAAHNSVGEHENLSLDQVLEALAIHFFS